MLNHIFCGKKKTIGGRWRNNVTKFDWYARPTMAAVDPDEGYIPRRAQEWLLSGPPGGDARQYAAMLGAQLAAHYHA